MDLVYQAAERGEMWFEQDDRRVFRAVDKTLDLLKMKARQDRK